MEISKIVLVWSPVALRWPIYFDMLVVTWPVWQVVLRFNITDTIKPTWRRLKTNVY